MIKWPNENEHKPNCKYWHNRIEDDCSCGVVAATDMRDACIEAEKNGRMSVEEVAKIIRVYSCWDIGEADCIRIAQSIVTALYGDTEEKA